MRSESDLRNDDEISGTNSEPLTTADLAASRARLGLGRGNGNQVTSRPEPRVLVSRDAAMAATAAATRMQRVTSGEGVVAQAGQTADADMGPLLAGDEAGELRERWENIQVGFVDEPRSAVEQADHLVAQTMQRLAETFAKERENLEHQWDRGGEASTEDLRLALRRYRAFFGRLMQV
jgi:hypothetical protein